MKKVYFKSIDSYSKTDEINEGTKMLLNYLVDGESVILEKYIPLKVHFGEKGNKTYIESKNFNGILEYFEEREIESSFMETNVLYRGQRTTSENHLKLAMEHGFTQLPVIIADGDHGENYEEIEINKKHFEKCKIGKEIAKQNQVMIISHFKGHALAGFGGAIKQLAMGCASRGGKLAQHANSIPKISYFKCKSCGACARNCPEKAIVMEPKAKIIKDKCVGCAACMTNCNFGAVSNGWLASLSKNFNERLAEYAYGAAKDKKNIYITFAFNITRNCDCHGHSMKPVAKDIGIFASIDPVAIDQACLDMLDKISGKQVFRRGKHTLEYAEKIGLGNRKYELIEI